MKKNQLSKAIAFALTGAALSMGAISDASATSTTMYNMSSASGLDTYQDFGSGQFNLNDPTAGEVWGYHLGGTDGWQNGGFGAATKWVGTSSAGTAAFGYTGQHLNWGLEISGGNGGTAVISTFDAFNRYGVYADIDTAKGAWSDNVSANTAATASGWRHDLEMGLFKTDMTGEVILSVEGILQTGTNFGFTIFKGMGSQGTYGHHGGWNAGNNENGLTSASLPGGGPNFDPDGTGPLTAIDQIVAYSVGGASPSNLNTISFQAEAGQIYAIWLGGYRNGGWGATTDGYKLTVSQVPVPAAAWLFGGAIASLIGANRRKRVVPD